MERAGISLRKKRSVRPKISAPQQISGPISSSSSSLIPPLPPPPPQEEGLQRPQRPKLSPSPSREAQNGSREREQGEGGGPNERPPLPRENTSEYVRRRYSTHLNKVPKDFANVPAVPAIPNQFVSPDSTSPSRAPRPPAVAQKIEVDLKALEDPHLRPDQYVAQILSNASEQEIRDYQNDLGQVRNHTSTDIQHNVHQNRSQFIKISQEAEKLKGEMRALRNLMSDLTGTLAQTNAALGMTSDTSASSRKYANRSSVANLEAMWSSHLHELWRRVEGSQKYLPAVPGRHVIHESGRWVELNTATWKPYRRIHIILLNDHLLIASEKKRPEQGSPQVSETSKPKAAAGPVQLVADKCWPLQDIEINDLASNANPRKMDPKKSNQLPTSNAFNVRVGSETFTYATTDKSNTEKASLLTKFRKSVTELRKALQGEVDEGLPSQRPVSASVRDSLTNVNGAQNPDTTAAGMANVLVEVDGRQQNFHWVETQVDELDIDIALQRFEEAVEGVEKLRRIAKSNKSNFAIQELVDGKVQDRAANLARAIIRQMADTHSSRTSTHQHVTWLSKLGFEVRASEAYLDARSAVIRTRTGQCADEGSLHHYLYQISFIYFTLIRNTIAIYQACFVPAMGSACIKWAKGHVDEFNVILAQQLGKLEADSEERSLCLQTAHEHALMLQDVGVDFRNIVGRGL